jgi:catechol 2,3-dioxygenase-like lactoylglutathione lyase family enzyme
MTAIKNLVLGLQHIGIPTNSIKETIDFFTSLDFTIIYETDNKGEHVAFLKLGDMVIETYENHQAAMKPGAIDQVALNVSDIDATYDKVRQLGYEALEKGIMSLPFFDHGVKYFTISGPIWKKLSSHNICSEGIRR